MTPERFHEIAEAVCQAGYADDVNWAQTVVGPENADAFAREAIYVICNSGMKFTIARQIYDRVMLALEAGKSATSAFGHPGKAGAIDHIWAERDDLFLDWLVWATAGPAKALEFCERLPWIGGITKYHLAKNFGIDVAKPDVHLQRLADHEGTTPQDLCERLAAATGFRVNTVDVVLWRACAIGIINSREL